MGLLLIQQCADFAGRVRRRIFAHYVLGRLGFLALLFFLCHPGTMATFNGKDYLTHRYPNRELAVAASEARLNGDTRRALRKCAVPWNIEQAARAASRAGAASSSSPAASKAKHQIEIASLAFVAAPRPTGFMRRARSFSHAQPFAQSSRSHRAWPANGPTMLLKWSPRPSDSFSATNGAPGSQTQSTAPFDTTGDSSSRRGMTGAMSVPALSAITAGNAGGDDRVSRARRLLGGIAGGAQDAFDTAASAIGCALVTHPLAKHLLTDDDGAGAYGGFQRSSRRRGRGTPGNLTLPASAVAHRRTPASTRVTSYDLVGFMDVDINRGLR
ncbi:hypothetical protein JKP88DRAFT_347339 [Tribonema minus]|uniref:Uncharacterized protein n=1 Tax=Tribonema minus TaxID=303371 RepID=A0A836CPJ6_9STRA|nr:hypothetical protein JKP88DRAFT_347339 [Tribonema minus]